MTTKTGEKLRGRKRDPSVLEKAWETRRRNKRKAKRSEALLHSETIGLTREMARGSKTRGRKAAKAPTSPTQIGRRSEFAERAAKATEKLLAGLNAPLAATTAVGASDADGANFTPAGQGLAVSARVALTIARKNGAAAEADMQALLHGVAHNARMEEQRGILEATTRQRREHLRVTNQKIVCGFIAEVDMAMAQGRGLPPSMVWNLNSFTVTKIVDALNAAGYHGNGFRDPVR